MKKTIKQIADDYGYKHNIVFIPTDFTLNEMGIKRKRYTRLVSGKTTKPLLAIELSGIASFFKINMQDILI